MKKMELFALEIDESLFYNETIYYMKMPESWRNFFNRERTDRFKLAYKVEPLGKKLRSMFPEIISVHSDNKVLLHDRPWLISTKPIPELYIRQLTLGWLAHLKGYSIPELPQDIIDSDPAWVSCTFGDIHEIVDSYQWVPGMAAIKFCQDPKLLDLGKDLREELKFYHVIFNGKHECISNPLQKSNRHDPFSYVIRLELKTRGGDTGRTILTVSMGTRRYLSKEQIKDGICFMRFGHSCSVLVTVKNPYETDMGRSFSQLKFERCTRSKSSFTAWESALDGLYWDVLNGEAFESDSLLVNPIVYFDGNGEVTAYVVNNNLFKGNSVKAGIGLSEKSGLFHLIKCFLVDFGAKELQLIPDITRREMNDSRFPMVAPNVERLTIEIYSSVKMFEKVIEVLTTAQKSIDIDPVVIIDKLSDSLFRLNCDKEVIVELVHCNPEGIVAELEIDKYKDKSLAQSKRINQISKQLSKAKQINNPVLGLVEIDEKNKWREGTDPKKAVREGMKKAGRLTQFIYPLTDDETGDISRIINAALDLFNDYGLFSGNVNKINVPGTLLSITVLKAGNKYLPAISRLIGTDLSIKMLGHDSWMSLQDAALKMDDSKFLDNPRKENRSSEVFDAFITKVIENELDRCEGQFVVLVNATLRNNWMRSIGNTKIQWDRTPVINERLSNESRLKFIRINATDDVPQYRIIINDVWNEFNKASGIFKDSIGAYYGVGGRPSAWKGIANDATKFSSPSKLLLQQRAVEYIPLGAKDKNEMDDLAILADHLRRLGLTYDKHTILPHTMRVLNSLSKYITGNEDDYDYDAEFDEEVEVESEEGMVEVK
ncbi:pPIWI_RE module domain-containing protein [Brevibacillus sp. 179-C9.3 HS]|uniref:pPIWI_RE module domain-containing protein n=1 Tax=unclassified Brevibacillus TaxID=2684853 RepID=UPI00399F777F